MSRSTVLWLPELDKPGEHDLRDYTVRLTGSGLAGDYLCLEYLVFPVPPKLLGDHDWHEGDKAGLALDGETVHRCCGSGYRTSEDGHCVAGAVKIGPVGWPVLGRVTVLFAPFAHTPGLHQRLCEVRLIVEAARVRGAQIRTI
jgi:hypothetical protein